MKAVIILLFMLLNTCYSHAWKWYDDTSDVQTLQAEFDEEVAAYRAQVKNGMKLQDRIITLDRLISIYQPQKIDTITLEAERNRLIAQRDAQEDKQATTAKTTSAKLYKIAMENARMGKYRDALSSIRNAERLVPEDKTIREIRRKLEIITAIILEEKDETQVGYLVRKGTTYYLENSGTRALNSLRYAGQLDPDRLDLIRLIQLVEKDFPALKPEPVTPGMTLVDQKLQLALEHVYNGKYLEAIDECNQVLDLEPDNVLALTRLGSAYYAIGKKNDAKMLWEEALLLDPSNKVLKKFLEEKF